MRILFGPFALALTLAAIPLIGDPAEPPPWAPIGGVRSFSRNPDGITLQCADGSAVRIFVLASDLVRVRAAFRHGFPPVDHSWAVARTQWSATPWSVSQSADAIEVTTAELAVRIARSPLLIAFVDRQTGRTINADWTPMGFDPRTGAVGAEKSLGLDEHFYGLGEKAAHLDKRRGAFTLWNSDTPGYTEGTDPIYQSVPFYLGYDSGEAYGIFFDNSYRSHFDFGSHTQRYVDFWAEGGELNYYFFWGPSLKTILGRYADLTGHVPLPPLWALGAQQSRYSYYPDTLAEAIVRRYRADDLPLDVLHLDIHYMRGFRDFTFDPRRFPDPKAFTAKLRALGVKVVTIVDPGIKYEPGDRDYPVYTEGAAHGYFLRRTNGSLYIGRVWPGPAVFVDYTLPAAERWWGDQHRFYLDAGVSGIWDDMNEPSDFVDKSGASQRDVVFYDEGQHSPYAKNRNVFALGMVRATYEGLRRLRPNERPFIITRAGYAGVQRYATMWTGDNTSTWSALALSLPMFESLGLSGETFVGADIPGFQGRADGELMTRWYEAAAFVPLCRNHASIDAYDHEPWRFGPAYEAIVRKYLKLRYRLLPYFYATLEQAHRTGVPWIRPLILDFQDDANAVDLDDEMMIGDDLLVAPVTSPGQTARLVYLPRGVWYDFWSGAACTGGRLVSVPAPLEKIPLFVRGGSMIPMAPAMDYVGERPWSTIDVAVAPDDQGKAAGTLYEDDGTSPAYERGVFRRTRFAAEASAGGIATRISASGAYRTAHREFHFFVLGRPDLQKTVDGGQ